MGNVKEFSAAFEALQKKDDYTLSEVRVLFDTLIEKVPELSRYLQENANIVHNRHFENGVVKVLDGLEAELSSQEKAALRKFKIIPDESGATNTSSSTNSRTFASPSMPSVIAAVHEARCAFSIGRRR